MPLSAKHCCLAVAIALSFAALPALAQTSATRHELSLPAQPLDDALIALGKTAHVSIAFEPASVAGLRAPVLQGNYTPGEALQQLLKGSGLSARQTAGGSYVVEAPSAKGADNTQARKNAKMLDTVRVTATVKGFSATRMPTALKDVPQSVSIIDQQTLREQNADDLSKALNWATGITLTNRDSTSSNFYSRGFQIPYFHIDGSAQTGLAANYAQMARLDLSQYESVELLRGADALFGGVGNPGGSINLTRKRPLPENAVSIAASAGSWDNYRVEADLSGKLSGDGRLRGRMVAVNENERYFYKTAVRRMSMLYGVAEYDLLPGTQVRLGGSVQRTPDYVSFTGGLPRYLNGGDPHLPRSASLSFPWATNNSTQKEGFLQLEHAFNEKWKLRTGISRSEIVQTTQTVDSNGTINPASGMLVPLIPLSPILRATSGDVSLKQTTADLTLLGSFDWNGRAQEVAVGFDASRSSIEMALDNPLTIAPLPIDLAHFDASSYPLQIIPYGTVLTSQRGREAGVFASVKLRPADGWAITAGARNSYTHGDISTKLRVGPRTIPFQAGSSTASGLLTPYLGIVYEISPVYSLYASYADVSDASSVGYVTAAGKLIDPSRGTNKELGVKAGWYQGRLNGSLALFDINKTNVALQDPRAPALGRSGCCYIPTTQRSKGFEAELSGQLTPGWTMSAGYTFDINRQGDGSTLSTATPKHLLKLWSSYQLPGAAQAWNIGGGIIAQSKNYMNGQICPVFNLAGGACSTAALVPYRTQQGFYALATLRVGYRVNENWNLALNVNNLLDRRYYQTIGTMAAGNWYGAPRNWMLTLRGEY